MSVPCVKSRFSSGNDLQTVLLLNSAFHCFFGIFGLASSDTVTTLMLSRLASFLPFFEVIPEIFSNFVSNRIDVWEGFISLEYFQIEERN